MHSFAAGVETLMPFANAVVVPANGAVAFTNGRGAFSAALAEHALAGMLYFNKDLRRCQANRRGHVWDSFVMDTMADKTIGLLGAGSIGLATGKAAQAAFGCRVVALRRQSGVEQGAGRGGCVLERVYGLDEKEAFFKECDFVVCSLPNTPRTKVGRRRNALPTKVTALALGTKRGGQLVGTAMGQIEDCVVADLRGASTGVRWRGRAARDESVGGVRQPGPRRRGRRVRSRHRPRHPVDQRRRA